MKLTFQQDDDTQPSPEARTERRSGFWRARAQLSQAVGGVLSNFRSRAEEPRDSDSPGALHSLRTQGALPSPSSSRQRAEPSSVASQHGLRLREVLERDRALVASQPLPSEPAQLSPEQKWLRAARDADDTQEVVTVQYWCPEGDDAELVELEQDSDDQERITQEFAAQDVLAAAEALAAREALAAQEVLVPRADAIARAIAEAIADTGPHEARRADAGLERAADPIRLEPLVAASSVTVVMPKKSAPCQEPIRTRTMAKLLAAQGHRERALSIYDHLLVKDANDPILLAEAEALRCAVD